MSGLLEVISCTCWVGVIGEAKRVKRFVFFVKQKTAYEIVSRDWSSDVCSSDLAVH